MSKKWHGENIAPFARSKAAVNTPQSRRFAQFEGVRQSRSVWTARVFSTAFRHGLTVANPGARIFKGTANDSPSPARHAIATGRVVAQRRREQRRMGERRDEGGACKIKMQGRKGICWWKFTTNEPVSGRPAFFIRRALQFTDKPFPFRSDLGYFTQLLAKI